MLHIQFALNTFFVQQFGNFFIGIGLQISEGQIFQFPFDFPNTQAIGQRCKDLQRLFGQDRRHFFFDTCKIAQRLQSRGQAQHDDAQIFAKRQQHFAHSFCLRSRIVLQLCSRRGSARHALHFDQLGGFNSKQSKFIAEGFCNHFLRAAQMRAGVHQVAGGLYIVAAVHGVQNSHDRIGMVEDVLAGV